MAEEEIKKLTNNKTFWYAAGAIVAILGYVWWKRKQLQTQTLNTNAAFQAEPSGAMGATTNLGSSGTTAASPIGTFVDWASQVQTWATSALGKDAADVQNALQAYNNMECLTPNQYAIIDQALAQFGAPPNAPFTGVVMCPQSAPSAQPTGTTTTSNATTAPWSIGQVVNPANYAEHIVSVAPTPDGTGWFGLTNLGGIYTSGTATLGNQTAGGSYLGYLKTLSPTLVKANIPQGPGTGLGNFTGGNIVAHSNNSYTITDSTGHTYTF